MLLLCGLYTVADLSITVPQQQQNEVSVVQTPKRLCSSQAQLNSLIQPGK